MTNGSASTPTGVDDTKVQASAALQKILSDLTVDNGDTDRQILINNLLAAAFDRQIDLSPTEAEHVYTIIEALIADVDRNIRTKIAEHLSVRSDAPDDLLMRLAGDEIEVAYPVLTHSDLLNDSDLLQLVVERAREHQVAISTRMTVSETVSEALVATNDPGVVTSLLENEHAKFSTSTMDQLVSMSRNVAEIRAPIVARHDLPPAHAAKLHVWVSDTLREQLVDRFEFEPEVLEAAISEAFLDSMATAAHVGTSKTHQQPAHSEAELEQTSKILLGFLRSGVKRRFEQLFSELADLPADSTRRVLYGMGMKGLACACRDTGFADNVFSRLLWHLHGSGTLAMFSLNPKHKEALSYYQSIDADQADSIMQPLRAAPPGNPLD